MSFPLKDPNNRQPSMLYLMAVLHASQDLSEHCYSPRVPLFSMYPKTQRTKVQLSCRLKSLLLGLPTPTAPSHTERGQALTVTSPVEAISIPPVWVVKVSVTDLVVTGSDCSDPVQLLNGTPTVTL